MLDEDDREPEVSPEIDGEGDGDARLDSVGCPSPRLTTTPPERDAQGQSGRCAGRERDGSSDGEALSTKTRQQPGVDGRGSEVVLKRGVDPRFSP